jgi:hypothetical protein
VEPRTIRLGLVAAPGLPAELGEHLAAELPELLADHVSGDVDWSVPVVTDPRAADPDSGGIGMIDTARRRLLSEDWDFAVLLTDLPLRIGRRPVVADVSSTHGVALVSLPALGAVQLRRRARDAVIRMVDGLMAESLETHEGGAQGTDRRRRVGRRLVDLARSQPREVAGDDDEDVRFVVSVVRGNLRLLAGMVRANRPWRLAAHLWRALAAAIAAAVFALSTSDIWRMADALSPLALAALGVASMVAIVVFLIASHGLWETAQDCRAREQVVLFNAATTLTLAFGVLVLYLVLFAVTLLAARVAIHPDVLSQSIGHRAGWGEYAALAWMASSLATVGGALGAGLETDEAVREAAYGYRPERETVRGSRSS